jgi:hypothetical protein
MATRPFLKCSNDSGTPAFLRRTAPGLYPVHCVQSVGNITSKENTPHWWLFRKPTRM